jgi:hypothetical protein
MEEEKKNTVLEVQNGFIDVTKIFKMTWKPKDKKEVKEDAKSST